MGAPTRVPLFLVLFIILMKRIREADCVQKARWFFSIYFLYGVMGSWLGVLLILQQGFTQKYVASNHFHTLVDRHKVEHIGKFLPRGKIVMEGFNYDIHIQSRTCEPLAIDYYPSTKTWCACGKQLNNIFTGLLKVMQWSRDVSCGLWTSQFI